MTVILDSQVVEVEVPDLVNHPPHYNQFPMEVIDIIEMYNLNFHQGNVIKYILRSPFKGTLVQDLEKAAWYLARDIKRQKEEEAKRPPVNRSLADEELANLVRP